MKHILMAGSLLLLLFACGPSTNITNSWRSGDTTLAHKALRKVMVVGLVAGKERALKEQMESRLAANLTGEGYTATTATAVFGPKAFENLRESQVIRKLRSSGVTGVITITLLDKDQEENYVPGRVEYYPAMVRYNRFFGYYRTYYNRVYNPGYYTNTTKYFFETNLYDITGNKLVYSAQSETFDPSSAESLAADYAKAIVRNLKAKQLVNGTK